MLSRDSSRTLLSERYPATPKPQGIALSASPKASTVIFTITTFDTEQLQSIHQQNCWARHRFTVHQLQQRETRRLILDLRENQEGGFEPGRYLLSYLIDRPVS